MSREYSDRKKTYYAKLTQYLTEYRTCLVVNADNVGSNQLQRVRLALRKAPKGVILMGKNTLARNCIRKAAQENPKLEKLLPLVEQNIGFVFTNEDAKAVRDSVLSVKVPAAARAGTQAQCDVKIPPGPTGLDPSQTSFFQSLNIATKIVKGAIEIITEVHLLKPGDRVGNSEVALLSKLNIRPFTYALKIVQVYEDGATYDSSVLDLTADALLQKFFGGVSKLAAISLSIGYPTLASMPHLVSNGYQKMLALSLATEYTFPQAQKFKDFLSNPGAFAAVASSSAAASSAAAPKEEAKAAEAAADDDDVLDGGFSLFD